MTRKPPTPLTLSEIEKIKVLKASGLSFYAVAKRVGREPKTVKRCCQDPRNAEEIKSIQQELASYFEDLSMRLITSVTDGDIEKLSGYQRVISAGICVDKLRLLRNESTENISMQTINANREDLEERKILLEKRLFELTGVNSETRLKKRRALETNPPTQ
ncbi:MAG: helix-turn-helix domain-containing protein [Planctomycetota bacterium]|jgi:hypothetical protein